MNEVKWEEDSKNNDTGPTDIKLTKVILKRRLEFFNIQPFVEVPIMGKTSLIIQCLLELSKYKYI